MEFLRPGAPLDRAVKPAWAAFSLLALAWLSAPTAGAHAGSFILAKCTTHPDGAVSLMLAVDYLQHPSLTTRDAATAALREMVRIESSMGPVPMEDSAAGVLAFESLPDPDIPLPPDPADAGKDHAVAVLRYHWNPQTDSIQFSIPRENPHDVLFWLAGSARPPGAPAPWLMLIGGDVTPPVALAGPAAGTILPAASPAVGGPAGASTKTRWLGAAGLLAATGMLVRWRVLRSGPAG